MEKNFSITLNDQPYWKRSVVDLNITMYLFVCLSLGLSLSCRQHVKDKFLADKPECFAQRPGGGCRKICDARLKCGHSCELICHNYDFE